MSICVALDQYFIENLTPLLTFNKSHLIG